MVRGCRMLLGLALVLLVAGPVLAQDPPQRGRGPQGGGRGGNPYSLLNEKGIREDLKLTEDQIKKLEAWMKDLKMPERTPGGDPQEMRAKMDEFRKNSEKELGSVLNADQVKRFKQLRLQQTQRGMGMNVLLANPEVNQALNLSDDQRETIREIGEETRRAMQEMRENQVPPQEMMAKMQEMNKANGEKVEKILTADQKAKLKELLGEPYKGEFPRPGMGRRPGGGR